MKTSNHYGLQFHHLGLAVKQPDLAVKFLSGMGYQIGGTVRDELQNVNVIFCPASAMPAVEIIFPTETPGPLTPLLKSKASLIYHICYESQNRKKTLSALEADRHRVSELSPPQPAVLFGGRMVSFYVVAGFGVIELLEPK
jgi:Glyoxalase/Bleomycin resistance protein/Dioxygenase superfamily